MDFNELKKMEPTFLTPARRKGYVCPICGSGSGTNGTGIVRWGRTGNFKCFSCGWYGDTLDLFGLAYGITDAREKILRFKEYEGEGVASDRIDQGKAIKANALGKGQEQKEEPDYASYFIECKAGSDGKYLEARGISKATQDRFMVGIDRSWRHPKAIETLLARGKSPDCIPATERLIVPRSRTSYLARDTRPDADVPANAKTYIKQSVGSACLYGEDALIEACEVSFPVFVVEGEIDAMSIFEAGGRAVALCSAANTGLLSGWLLKHDECRPSIILMLDNDESGMTASKMLADDLVKIGCPCKVIGYGCHDPNGFLINDREGLVRLVDECAVQLKKESEEAAKKFAESLFDRSFLNAHI